MLKTEGRRYHLRMKIHFPSSPAGQAWATALERSEPALNWAALEDFLSSREAEGAVIYPPEDCLLRAFSFFPPERTNVCILGQDPYHGPGQAHGLSFSVPGQQKTPPSLRNILKEARSSTGAQAPATGDLTGWARQGVLLLNALLTVEKGAPGAHQGRGWEEITDRAIQVASERSEGCVFMLWGAYAIKKSILIDASKHLVLTSPHPSPLSAHRGFLGNRHFALANEFLAAKGQSPIDWSASV